MFAAIVVMYALALAEWATGIHDIMWYNLQIVPTAHATASALETALSVLRVVANNINVVIGVAIVLWRGCVIQGHNKLIRRTCASLFFFSFVSWTIATVDSIEGFAGATHRLQQGAVIAVGIASYTSALLANVVSTGSIVMVAMKQRAFLRKQFRDSAATAQPMANNVLTLLIVSGATYCVIWAVGFISASGALGAWMEQVTGAVVNMATPIYPTVVLFLAALQHAPMAGSVMSKARGESKAVWAARLSRADDQAAADPHDGSPALRDADEQDVHADGSKEV